MLARTETALLLGLLALAGSLTPACGDSTDSRAGSETRSNAGAEAAGSGGTSASAGSAGSGGSSGGTAGAGGTGGVPSSSSDTCQSGLTCDPSDPPCVSCRQGGTAQYWCHCTLNGEGQGHLSCGGGSAPCGSNGCSAATGESCSATTAVPCDYCDQSGVRQSCRCGSSGQWECTSASGACGVRCGDRTCLSGEICVTTGRASGSGGGGPSPLVTTSSCAVVPDACAGQDVSCDSCIGAAYGCQTSGPAFGTCTDVSADAFQCIQSGV